MTTTFTPRAVALAAAACLSVACTPALAQSADAPAPKPADGNGLNLETIVVTGTSVAASKMKQSVSISTMDAEQIEKTGAVSAAEVLRSIPGIRSESTGGEGNANLTVRGVPISAGGARYVQFQEDGLPVLLFGDIAFGTADQFLRADYMLDRLEAIRGGSASTLASNSPGGIINFISKTGRFDGGDAGLSFGLGNHFGTRVDFDYGGQLAKGLKFQVGGFQRAGRGGRDAGMNTEDGGQIRGNLTKEFDGGYVRLSFKHLDDRTPSYMPVPVTTDAGGNIHEIPGIDPRTAYFITPALGADTSFTRNGDYTTTSTRDGLRVKSDAIGIEASFKLADDVTVTDKYRRASNSGRFIALFPADNGNNGTEPFTGTLFNTSLDDLGNQFNDLRLAKTFGLSNADKLTLSGGLFSGTQNVAETWFWNQYRLTLQGTGAQPIDASGNPTTQPVATGWQTWGGCCVRTFDVQYAQTSPYAALTWEHGPFGLDASLRRDEQRATGWYESGDIANQRWDEAGRKTVNYKVDHTSYSVGGNWQVDPALAVFARVSDGVSYSADRLLYGKPLDGSVPIDVNEVKQVEGGVKWKRGSFSGFVTLFDARTKESNYEVTTQTFTNNSYKADGIEFEMGWRLGDFRLGGGATWTHARITATADGSNVGHTPRRQADLTYQLNPSYAVGAWEVGAAIVGTTKSYGNDENTITLPGFTVVNPYLTWQASDKMTVQLAVNNLFNAIGYTEIEGDGHAARSVNGRTARVSLKYAF
jgi:outer membrane receptor protein involved in Fe transport